MSTYAQFDDDGNQYQIASNLGWSEAGDWIEKLDHDQYPNLYQLWEHGISQDVKSLAAEIEEAIKEREPSSDIMGTLDLLLAGLHANESAEFVLTTG